jgi:cation diffusion facilitator CzcD-associated flavoprotein CzcO
VSGGQPVRVAIIGSGFSGLCLGIQLKQAGFDSFTILEKAERLGGTWRENTYPGAACDLMSFAYCFSFEQKTDWSRKWSPQEEILAYMDHCAEKYRILPHCRFGTEVSGARFDAEAGVWHIQVSTADGGTEQIDAEVLVSGVGQLHRPVFPKIPGLERFEGDSFHSAQWDHDVDLTGKRIGVIGNGASAIQFVPEIAGDAEHLTVFQRSANWMAPRGDREYTEVEKERFTRHPWLAKLYRWMIWARQELMFPVFTGNEFMAKRWREFALSNMEEHIADPELRKALTPDYPVGGKRILIHDTYYPALALDHVDVETSAIESADETGVRTADGREHALDVIIFATGFDTNSFLAPMRIEGLHGRVLEKDWEEGSEAYLGLTATGYPNLFMMYGPNTNLGHNSIIFMIECQANYILQCVRRLRDRGLRYLEVRPGPQRIFNEKLHRDLAGTAWAKAERSWYKTPSGKITNNWSGTTTRYWRATRRVDFDAYRQVR